MKVEREKNSASRSSCAPSMAINFKSKQATKDDFVLNCKQQKKRRRAVWVGTNRSKPALDVKSSSENRCAPDLVRLINNPPSVSLNWLRSERFEWSRWEFSAPSGQIKIFQSFHRRQRVLARQATKSIFSGRRRRKFASQNRSRNAAWADVKAFSAVINGANNLHLRSRFLLHSIPGTTWKCRVVCESGRGAITRKSFVDSACARRRRKLSPNGRALRGAE